MGAFDNKYHMCTACERNVEDIGSPLTSYRGSWICKTCYDSWKDYRSSGTYVFCDEEFWNWSRREAMKY